MFHLDQKNGEAIPLLQDRALVIGRGDQCDLRLDDPSVSRIHCRILVANGKVTLIDAASRWGTLVNGHKVGQCDLRPGDRVTVGDTVLQLRFDGDAAHTTLAPRRDMDRPNGISIVDENIEEVPHGESGSHSDCDESIGNQPTRNGFQSQPPVFTGGTSEVTPEMFLGTTFHRYRVLQTIAVAGSGIVFRAKDTRHGKILALKIFKPAFLADEVAAQRFERAVRIMFGQRHPNIVELYNAGRMGKYCFTASELVEGESAVDLIRRIGVAGMLDPSTVLQIAMDLCEALRFAESIKIVHRNIKPSNILITRRDDGMSQPKSQKNGSTRRALLNDLILARASSNSPAADLTQPGAILGEVCYMTPEQLGSGHPVDCRSDIYQLGVTLYALLTGRPPHDGGRMSETMTAILTVKPIPIQACHLATPAQFDTLVLKMLEKNPRNRFQSATDLSDALRKVAAETGQRDLKALDADPRATGWKGALDGLL